MTKFPLVSVIMSNYNGVLLNLVIPSLKSILANDYPNLEVILIDNASIDNSVSLLKKKFSTNPKFKIIQNHINMYSQGLNLGIKNSNGKYVAFFNNDVKVGNGFFQEFIKFLEKNPEIALSQGKLVSYFNHNLIDSAGETMDRFGNPTTIGQGENATESFNEINEVLSVSGSCSILRKSVVDKIGFFDDDYGIGYEDLDLALRVWLKNFKVVYFPKVIAYHKRAATDLSPMVKGIVRWHFNKNRLSTLIKNYPISFLIINIPVTLLIYTLAGVWEIFIKRNYPLGITRFTSILWVFDHLPTLSRKRKEVQNEVYKNGAIMIEKLLYKNITIKSFISFLKAK